MNLMISKRGEIEAQQVVLLVIAIVGFLIVLLLWVTLKDVADTTDTTCKLTVITRATSPQAVENFVPLKCSVKKICLTDGPGNCEDSFAGESGVKVVQLTGDDYQKANIIDEESANAMYNCWDLMGQGKLDLFSNYAKSRGLSVIPGQSAFVQPYCVVCSRVAIDKGVSQTVMNNVDVYTYMKENKVPGLDINYVQAMTDKQFSTYPVYNRNLFEKQITTLTSENGKFDSSGKRQISFLFMQIKAQSVTEVLSNLGSDGLAVAGGSLLTMPTRSITGTLLLKGGLYAAAAGVGIAAQASINAYSGQMMAAGYCGDLTGENQNTASWVNGYVGTSKGCSLVQAVPYDFKTINQLCGVIEGSV